MHGDAGEKGRNGFDAEEKGRNGFRPSTTISTSTVDNGFEKEEKGRKSRRGKRGREGEEEEKRVA